MREIAQQGFCPGWALLHPLHGHSSGLIPLGMASRAQGAASPLLTLELGKNRQKYLRTCHVFV